MTRRELCEQVHQANIKWWQDINTGALIQANLGEKLMLIISELSEALEGARKNLQDDKLPHRKMIEVELADATIRTMDTLVGFGFPIDEYYPSVFRETKNVGELLIQVAALISNVCNLNTTTDNRTSYNKYVGKCLCLSLDMIEDISAHLGLDHWGAFHEKNAYNATRLDHQLAHRQSAHGKKY